MKISPGQDQVTIPGLYQVLTVAVSGRRPETAYEGPWQMVMRITIEQYHELKSEEEGLPPEQRVGIPRYYTQSGETLYLWPPSDIERELEVQYHTHVMRA